MDLTVFSYSEAQTESIGHALGLAVQPGDVLALVGDLGAGKTCLTRGIARGLGIDEPVTSPTFILVAVYASPRGCPLYHADCYRLGNADVEAQDIGLDEIMSDNGVCVIEWADRIQRLLPPDHLLITMTATDDTERQLHFHPTGPRAVELLQGLQAHPPENCEW
jgi:tRNA threonylcarbamoyladenosine biosynthesis protein TsaE